jgi:hypothetical protein
LERSSQERGWKSFKNFFKFLDNENKDSFQGPIKLIKIYSVILHLNGKFQELCLSNVNILREKSLALEKGSLTFKRSSLKLSKFGIKTFELCDSTQGICDSF